MTVLVLKVLGILGLLVFAGWLYFLTVKVMLVLTYAEQLLGMASRLLTAAGIPTVPRTVGPAGAPPAPPWYARLRLLTALRELLADLSARPGVGPHTTVKDALTADPPPAADVDTDQESAVDEDEAATDTFPAVPATAPTERVEIAGGLRLPPEGQEPPTEDLPSTPPIVDDVDLQLVRWGLRTSEGHRL